MSGVGKSPAFQFYAAEWLADEHVRLMTLAETGAYIDALAICWREGSIPADPGLLARLIGKGCTIEIATCVQLRFNIRSTGECGPVERLQHKRLNAERIKQEARSKQMAEAGKKSAAKKAQVAGAAITKKRGNLGSTQVQPKYNSSSSSSDEDGRFAQVGVSAVAGDGLPLETTPTGTAKRKQTVRATETWVEPTIPASLQSPEFETAWREWKQHRREIKHPLQTTQAQKQIDGFTRWGSTRSVIAINWTIMKGWRGIAEPDDARDTAIDQKPKQSMPVDVDEMLRRGYNPQTGLGPKL